MFNSSFRFYQISIFANMFFWGGLYLIFIFFLHCTQRNIERYYLVFISIFCYFFFIVKGIITLYMISLCKVLLAFFIFIGYPFYATLLRPVLAKGCVWTIFCFFLLILWNKLPSKFKNSKTKIQSKRLNKKNLLEDNSHNM